MPGTLSIPSECNACGKEFVILMSACALFSIIHLLKPSAAAAGFSCCLSRAGAEAKIAGAKQVYGIALHLARYTPVSQSACIYSCRLQQRSLVISSRMTGRLCPSWRPLLYWMARRGDDALYWHAARRRVSHQGEGKYTDYSRKRQTLENMIQTVLLMRPC